MPMWPHRPDPVIVAICVLWSMMHICSSYCQRKLCLENILTHHLLLFPPLRSSLLCLSTFLSLLVACGASWMMNLLVLPSVPHPPGHLSSRYLLIMQLQHLIITIICNSYSLLLLLAVVVVHTPVTQPVPIQEQTIKKRGRRGEKRNKYALLW